MKLVKNLGTKAVWKRYVYSGQHVSIGNAKSCTHKNKYKWLTRQPDSWEKPTDITEKYWNHLFQLEPPDV